MFPDRPPSARDPPWRGVRITVRCTCGSNPDPDTVEIRENKIYFKCDLCEREVSIPITRQLDEEHEHGMLTAAE